MRIGKFALLIGITFIILSYSAPSYEATFGTFSGVDPGYYRGSLFQCRNEVHIRISSWHNEVFSVYFIDYNNCIQVLEEVSLENMTAIRTFSNISQVDEWIPISSPGWYAIIVQAENNQTIEFIEYDIKKPVPNQGFLLLGMFTLIVGIILNLQSLQIRFYKKGD